MKHTQLSFCVVAALLLFVGSSEAALVKRVAPFQGQYFEGFEPGQSGALNPTMGGLASFSGSDLTVQDGNYFNLWNQHAFEGNNFLGASAGYGSPAIIEITFAVPVNAFGGLFGHRVRPGVESAGDTDFVFYDANNRVIGRDKLMIGSEPGSEAAYWQFTRGVKRITLSYVHPMADALTAQVSAVNGRRLERKLAATLRAQR